MRRGADLRGGTPLVSINHVIDPHFVTFSSSLYTTIRKPNPNLTLILTITLILTLALTLNRPKNNSGKLTDKHPTVTLRPVIHGCVLPAIIHASFLKETFTD